MEAWGRDEDDPVSWHSQGTAPRMFVELGVSTDSVGVLVPEIFYPQGCG